MKSEGSPYDLQHIYQLSYTARSSDLTAEELRDLRNKLSEAVEVSLGHGRRYQSPLFDLFPEDSTLIDPESPVSSLATVEANCGRGCRCSWRTN